MDTSESVSTSGTQQIPVNEKLRIAIETLLTGKLKDNHDDTLFEKFCSLLQSDLTEDQLISFVVEQNIFQLINANLPQFEKTKVETRNDIVAFFRIFGSLLSHESTFKLYLQTVKEKSICDVGQILGRMSRFFIEKLNEDTVLVAYSMLSFMNYISSHKSGAEWLFSFFFDNGNLEECRFTIHIVPFTKATTTHYIQKEIYTLFGNLLNLIDWSSPKPRFQRICKAISTFLLKPFEEAECKLIFEVLSLVHGDKKVLIESLTLVRIVQERLKEPVEDEQNCFGKLICLIAEVHGPGPLSQPVSDLLDEILTVLSKSSVFSLMSFLSLAFDIEHPVNDFRTIRAYWFALMTKLISLVKSHYFGVHVPSIDSKNQFILDAFNSMAYPTFEFNCLKILNRINVKHLTIDEVLLLIDALKPIASKLRNRKHAIFVITFFEEFAKEKSNQIEVITEILSIYCDLLRKMTPFTSLILKSSRSVFQQSSSLLTKEAMFEKIHPILIYFIEYLSEPDHDFDDCEQGDIIIENVFHLTTHLDLIQITQFGIFAEKCSGLLQKLIDIENTFLLKDNLEPSIRSNIVSTMYYISRYRFNSLQTLPISIGKSSFEEQLSTAFDYDISYRQTLYGNFRDIFGEKESTISFAEVQFSLPLLCKFCYEETDTELQCILLQIIETISGHALRQNDTVECAQCFLDSGLFALVFSLLNEPLVMYRTKLATLSLHEQMLSKLTTQADLRAQLSFSRQAKLNEVASPEKAFDFVEKSSPGELRRSVETERDCPQVSILDDIIYTSLAEDMVMDCY